MNGSYKRNLWSCSSNGNGKIVEEGDVYDVFANPKQPITKKFMSSTSSLGKLEKLEEKHSNIVEVKEGQTLVELQFGKMLLVMH